MIARPGPLSAIRRALQRQRIVILVGARQSGKTTLAREVVPVDAPNYFDLEDPASLALLAEPMTALAELRGVVVIDEVQRRPDLFPVLRVLADRRPLPARFLLLGSASPELLRQSSESLAGRAETIYLGGLSLAEVGVEKIDTHWLRGGFPRSFLARTEADSRVWRRDFVRMFLERDVPQLGFSIPASALHRFWTMLAHWHGAVWNAAEPARSLGVSESTVRRYLDLLTGSFMVRQLLPWHENLGKRQVKSPKIYLRDCGIAHELLGIGSRRELQAHPKCGASWEGYVLEQVLVETAPDESYFWATHQGAELDLLLLRNGRRLGVEIKRSDAPSMTPSMRIALADLGLEQIVVIYPGTREYRLHDRVRVLPVSGVAGAGLDGLFPRPRRRPSPVAGEPG